MNEFDSKAAGWDLNPITWERAEAIANEIKKLIPLKKEMTALEFGAGTGITSFILKESLKEITLMDNSSEMVKVMNNKIKISGAGNLKTLNFDLEQFEFKDARFDFVFNQLVLHHIADIEDILRKFCNLLNPGGFLAIADFYTEDGSFHSEGFTGHRGFDIEILSEQVRKAGFINISHSRCYVMDRKISETETKKYDVFLLTAKKGPEETG